jgi:predicted adenylyl cyclase CyaB
VQKRRTVFLIGQTRIHLDDVDGLGSFMEFEVVLRDGQSVAQGEQIAAHLMGALSVSPADLIRDAYVDLLESGKSAWIT